MKKDRMHRNYTEENDLTSAKKRIYIRDHVLLVDFIKTVEQVTGIFALFRDEGVSRLDSRDTRKIKYSIQAILIVCLLSNCLGISAIRNLQTVSIFPRAVENIAYLTGQDLDEIPNYETLNNALAGITDISWFEEVAQDVFEKLHRSGRYGRYHIGGKRKLKLEDQWIRVILDATDFAFFRFLHCIEDLKATFHKGTNEEKSCYYHKALVAKAVLGPHLMVPIAIEFIKNKDVTTTSKQDCENAAALRALERIKRRFPKMHFRICGDALYANKTFISKCIEYKWECLFTLKKGSQPSLCEVYEYEKKHGELKCAKVQYGDNETGILFWSDDLGSVVESDLPIYILEYVTTITLQKGKSKRNTGSVSLRRKDFTIDMPELSKDFGKYDLDEKAVSKRKKAKAQKKALKEEGASDKIKEAVAKINQDQAADINDATVHASSKEPKVGDSIEVTFMYITNIPITEENACTLLVQGRDRWSIEEDFRNAKLGTLQIEHLRTLDSKGMEVYFWLEQLASTLQELYIYHSDILKIAGSRKEIFELLRNSFENQSLQDSREYLSASTRICLRARDEEHHSYPKAKIIAEGTSQTIKTMGMETEDTKSNKANGKKTLSQKTSEKETGTEAASMEAKPSSGTPSPSEKEKGKNPQPHDGSVEEATYSCPLQSMKQEDNQDSSDFQKSEENTVDVEREKKQETSVPILQKEPEQFEVQKTQKDCDEKTDGLQENTSPENSPEGRKGLTRHYIRLRLYPGRKRSQCRPGADLTRPVHQRGNSSGPGDDKVPSFGSLNTATKGVE